MVVSAWNPSDVGSMALPPCHCLFQFYVSNNKLSCQLYQRSADIFLGVPFNIASYAFLTHLVAKHCGLKPVESDHFLGNVHIYSDHLETLELQKEREPYNFPTLKILNTYDSIDQYKFEDFLVENYEYHGELKMIMRK
jgi:thymidylate synthase